MDFFRRKLLKEFGRYEDKSYFFSSFFIVINFTGSMFSDDDVRFMNLALEEAKKSVASGNYPVGAVLVADGKVIAKAHNKLKSQSDWASHAESVLLREHSSKIKSLKKEFDSSLTLYSTLEPCLMCLGTIVLHRLSRVIFSCPDPHGGVMHLDPALLKDWYVRK